MSVLSDANRLRVLAATGLLDSKVEAAFERLTRLAARVLRAPTALVSLIDAHRQFLKSAVGVAEPWATRRETPLSHSFCQHVVGDRAPLVVSDARVHARLRDSVAARELGVVAYAGFPLVVEGEAVGAFCVADGAPREWPADELRLLEDLAACVVSEIELRLALRGSRAQQAEHERDAQIYRAIVQNLPGGAVFMLDRELRYVSADGPILPEILQRTDIDDLVGKRATDVVAPANRDRVLTAYGRALGGERQRIEVVRDGHWFETTTVPITVDGEVTHLLVASFDVTEQRREHEALRETRDTLANEQALLEATLSNIADGVALLDEDATVLLCNAPFAELVGLQPDEARGLLREQFLERLAPLLEDPASFRADFSRRLGEAAQHEYVFARPRRRIMRRSWSPVRTARGQGFLVTWHDVTAERDLLRERERQLLVDALTGIPNRRAAEAALRTEQERMKRAGTPMCVAVFDVDHFKQVNDRHGHGVGDEVLKVVAATLAREARLTDTVARWGGEEFLAVLNVPLEGARAFCERARAAVERLACPPVERITISVGVAQVAAGEPAAGAVARADARLYEAKSGGRNRVVG